MNKRDKLHQWLLEKDDWFYLSEIPHDSFGMSKQTCHTSLSDFCRQERVDFRIVGLRQYKAKDVKAIKKGPKPPKELK